MDVKMNINMNKIYALLSKSSITLHEECDERGNYIVQQNAN